MKVLVNAATIPAGASGMRTYLLNILPFVASDPRVTQMSVIVENRDAMTRAVALKAGAELVQVHRPIGKGGRFIVEQLRIPVLCWRSYRNHVLLSPANYAALLVPGKQVLVVHAALSLDGERRRLPGAERDLTKVSRLISSRALGLSIARADGVIAVSEYLKRGLEAEYPSAANRIRVIYEGVTSRFLEGEGEPLEDRRSILVVGTLYGYKNVDRAIEIFAHWRQLLPQSSQYVLEIIGRDPNGKSVRNLAALASRLGVAPHVRFLGELRHEALAEIYGRARLLLFLSEVEAFGLPPLEAMALGTPVAASRVGAIPEVVRNAARYVDPHATEAAARLTADLLTDDRQWRIASQRGQMRARKFTWQRSADELVASLEGVMKCK